MMLWWMMLAVAPCDTARWRASLTEFRRTRPTAEAQDFYKLAHQGTMGSEHAVGDGRAAQAWMQQEVATLEPAPRRVQEPLIEPLPPDGRFVRVNLRPYLAKGLPVDSLTAAFVRTANTAPRDAAQLECALASLSPGSAERAVFEAQAHTGFDAVHHSSGYEQAYRPAYRVVSRSEAERLVGAAR